jgi:hypothetical protein
VSSVLRALAQTGWTRSNSGANRIPMHRMRHVLAGRDQLAVPPTEPGRAAERRVGHPVQAGEDVAGELGGIGPDGVGIVPFEGGESLPADAVAACPRDAAASGASSPKGSPSKLVAVLPL